MTAADFVDLDAAFVRIDGLPFEDGPSDWHVNERLAIGSGSDPHRRVLVFQRADAGEEWVTIQIDCVDGQPLIAHVSRFAGEKQLPTESHQMPEFDLTIVATADSEEGLDD